jgi:hypothetical protein
MTHNEQHHHDHADIPDHDHDDSGVHGHQHTSELLEEQSQIAREIGEDLTEAFVSYVRGDVSFDDLVFGVFDALSDLNVVASGEYELEDLADHQHDGQDDEDEDDAF